MSRYLVIVDNDGKAANGLFEISPEGPNAVSDSDLEQSGYPGELKSPLYWLSMWRNILTSLAAVDELVASQWHPTNHQKKAGHISWTVLGQDQITARLRSPYSAGPVSHKRRLWPIGENIPSPSNAHSLLLKSLNLPKKLVYGGWKPFIR